MNLFKEYLENIEGDFNLKEVIENQNESGFDVLFNKLHEKEKAFIFNFLKENINQGKLMILPLNNMASISGHGFFSNKNKPISNELINTFKVKNSSLGRIIIITGWVLGNPVIKIKTKGSYYEYFLTLKKYYFAIDSDIDDERERDKSDDNDDDDLE